jgi:Cu(I)/Ag(I) efflux system membrane protein CusA/SilA
VLLATWPQRLGRLCGARTPLDALPDLSDVQVIIRTTYPGQAPRIVENQVTYPLTTTMLSVPGAKTVRGYSFFGDSFVYVLFEDGTDLYWARSRVLEYLNQVQSRLPAQAKASLGPDATGVGWIYEYALVDRSGKMDISQLRALQDWFLKYELKTVPDVAEVATVGGMVRQYQIVLDPTSWRPTASRTPRSSRRSSAPTRRPAARCWSWARPSTWCAPRATCRAGRLPQVPLMTTAAGVPVRWATWRGSRSGRRCGAASANSTARRSRRRRDRDALGQERCRPSPRSRPSSRA